MISSSCNLYRAADVREFDRIAIEEFHIPGSELMTRAGRAALDVLRAEWPQARGIAVVCGVGNNGGDGFALARLAAQAGMTVKVLQAGDAAQIKGDALDARQTLLASGMTISPFTSSALQQAEVIVDALFGTGLARDVSGEWRAAIEAINASGRPVLALDIPSGLHADTGRVPGVAVRAEVTVSFIALKQGMFTAHGPDCCGSIVLHDLDVPSQIFARIFASGLILHPSNLPRLAARLRNTHKGDYGRVLVIGGDHGMPGAVRMAAEAAARVGAGLVSIATRSAHAAHISAQRPELLCYGVENANELRPLLSAAGVIVIGPGLGQSPWARQLFSAVLEVSLPCVVDADALNLLAAEPVVREAWVLTPHAGEAARLLACSGAEIQADRFNSVREVQRRYGGVVVLKGAGTLVAAGDEPIGICAGGNPGMASAGMGDVLSGVIAGLIAQGLSLRDAARLGVWLHAEAGDRAAQSGQRGLLASDLMAHLHTLVNRL